MRKILLYGLGKSNLALYKLMLRDSQLDISVSGDKIIFPEEIAMHHRYLSHEIDFTQFDDVYVTPGISEKHELFTKCQPKNEIDYAYRYLDCRFIGVTGSNGKSTSCKLLNDCLVYLGKLSKIAGNYGIPLSEVVLQDEVIDYVIIELSSFQLRVLQDIRFDAVIVTNIEPNHLDWHVDMESYKSSKLSILGMLNEQGLAVIESEEICGRLRIPHCFANETKLNFTPINKDKLSQWKSITPVLQHLKYDTKVLKSFNFVSLEHRMQHLLSKSGILCINDSKSTTPGSSLFALESLEQDHLLLILGGKSKGLDLDDFLSKLSLHKDKIEKLYIYGDLLQDSEKISKLNIAFVSSVKFTDLMLILKDEVKSFHTVLLSPAFSSLDQFKSFEERGKQFIALTQEF
ncbi:Mur ligase family protein [bacterium]|nr:Mur ligase family protein [bacterium]